MALITFWFDTSHFFSLQF